MGYIGEILSGYRELHTPLRRSFLPWRSGPVFISLCLLYILAILALLCYSGHFFAGLNGALAQLCLKFGELLRRALLPAAAVSWVLIALANLRIADRLLDEALLGRRGSAASFRFILALQSGLPVMLTALVLSLIVTAGLLGFAANANEPGWLQANRSWSISMAYSSRSYSLELAALLYRGLLLSGFTAIALAVACMARRSSSVWLVFCLLNMQCLLQLIDCFHPINVYAMYWQDTMYNPNFLLLALSLAMAALPLLLPILHLAQRDQPLMLAFVVLSLARAADLIFSLSSYGFIPQRQYDDAVRPLSTFAWHLNLPLKLPFFDCRPENYNMLYGFGSADNGGCLVVLLDQIRHGLHAGAWGYGLALIGNLAWLALVLWACHYSVQLHEHEQIT